MIGTLTGNPALDILLMIGLGITLGLSPFVAADDAPIFMVLAALAIGAAMVAFAAAEWGWM